MGKYLEHITHRHHTGKDKMPMVLSIAGLDPSGGAGLLADIKAMHAQGVYALGVASCNTIQTDQCFDRLKWVRPAFINTSIKALSSRFNIQAVKIGVIKNRTTLYRLLNAVHDCFPKIKVVWDPVFNATAGGRFFNMTRADLKGENAAHWKAVLKRCTVVTPNAEEAAMLIRLLGLQKSPIKENELSLDYLKPLLQSACCHAPILLKGGHLGNNAPEDWLFFYEPVKDQFQTQCFISKAGAVDKAFKKHGSGCVHSSIVTAQLALGSSLQIAAQVAKEYMESFLSSSKGLLGVH